MNNFNVIKFDELESTNSYVTENIESLKNLDVIVAKKQTSGRGRFDRIWNSDSDNLLMTIVIKPDDPKNFPYVNLTQYLSVIMTRVLKKKYFLDVTIKWPNDILANGKKTAGILCEGVNDKNGKLCAALGTGLNVNMEETEAKTLPNATSMKILTGKTFVTEDILNDIMFEFTKFYNEFAIKGFGGIIEEYTNLCKFTSKTVKITNSHQSGEFEPVGINFDGTLSVRDKDGKIIKILNGDITC